MDNPTVAYQASTSGVTFGYASAAYPASARVTYTYWDAGTHTESLQAPYAQVDAPAGFGLPDILFRLPPPGTTYGEPGIKVYYAVRPSALSDYWTPWTLRETDTTPQTSDPSGRYQEIALSALATVRLKHASGEVDWEHDSIAFRVRSANVAVLQTPFATLEVTPDTLVGKDPASALPAYCPAPVASTASVVLGGGAGTVPAAPAVCTHMRCGVAGQCSDHLVSLYEQWAGWLDPLVAGITDFAVIVALIDPFFDALIEGMELASDIAIAKALQQVLKLGVGAIAGSLFPGLDPDQQQELKRALFCALTCTGDAVTVTTGNIAAWHDAVAALTDLPGLSRDLLTPLLQFTPLADWQARASQSGPSSVCDGWTCP